MGAGEVLILRIIEKIGRQDAERAYHETLVPAVKVCLSFNKLGLGVLRLLNFVSFC